MDLFHKSYLEYLGAEGSLLQQGMRIFPSISRVEPESSLSTSWQHLIVSSYNDMLIHSIAPSLLPEYREHAPDHVTQHFLEDVDDAFARSYNGRFYRIREMFRYSTDRTFSLSEKVTVLKEEHRELILNRMGRRGEVVRRALWRSSMMQAVMDGRLFSVLRNGEEIARSNVTPLDFDAANISVWTHPEHRGKGYGKAVVSAAARWCRENRRIPIYLVSPKNEPSVALAESLGFKRMATEIQTLVIRY